MKEILAKLNEGIIITNIERNIVYCNQSILSRLDVTSEAIIGKNIEEILDIVELNKEDYRIVTLKHSKNSEKYMTTHYVETIWEGMTSFCYIIQFNKNKQSISIASHEEIQEPSSHIGGQFMHLFHGGLQKKNRRLYNQKVNMQHRKLHIAHTLKDVRKQYAHIHQEISLGTEAKKVMRYSPKEKEEDHPIDHIANKFFSNISHEFRTPINIILSSIQLIKSRNDDDALEKDWLENMLGKIRKNALRLLRLESNLVFLTERDIGTEKLHLTNCNIVNVIENSTLSAVPYASNNKIDIIFDTQEETITMNFDIDKIQCMIFNLLSNSIKNTPQYGSIYVDVLRINKDLVIKVADTGNGIPENKIDTIFKRCVQGQNLYNRSYEGGGLGLAIVKEIVMMHDGSISVSSNIGKGSIFTVRLPIYESSKKVIEDENISHVLKMDRCNMEFSDILNSK